MRRKKLTLPEKKQVLQDKPYCFICGEPVSEKDMSELIFDHIKSLDAGGSNALENYAGVHKKCHKGKGTKSLEDYKEELRLGKEFSSLLKFTDVAKKLNPTSDTIKFRLDYENREIRLGDNERAPLYRCPNTKLWYFYYPIPRKYLDSDVDVQPRDLEHKRLRELSVNLRRNFQLSPTVCRLVTSESKIKVFDGQHKATAQALGNQNDVVDCKVFIDPPLDMVRRVVIDGHGSLRQQQFKTSELYRKLAADHLELLKEWQNSHPGVPISEAELPQILGKTKKEVEKDIKARITQSIYGECGLAEFVSLERRPGVLPLSYDMFAWWVNLLIKKPLVTEPMESDQNFREEERQNIIRLFDYMEENYLEGKWTPSNPDNIVHKKTRRLFFRASFREWAKLIAEALHNIMWVPSEEPVFYQNIEPKEWLRIEEACQKLIDHPIWMDTQPEVDAILNSNVQQSVAELFKDHNLILEYLCKP